MKVLPSQVFRRCKEKDMAEKKAKKVAAPKRATDARKLTAKNPTKVTAPNAAAYKMIKPVAVTKGRAGRPKKPS